MTGISAPWLGVSWSNDIEPRDRFDHLLFYLESKRILTNPIDMEIKEDCICSVLEIKSTLIEITKDIVFSDEEKEYIRKLVSACNDYLDAVDTRTIPHLIGKDGDFWANTTFDTAMKKFRFAFRDVIKEIEKKYNLKFKKEIPDKY